MDQENLKALLKQSILKAGHKFEAPPICLEISGEHGKQIFATLGNFSTILARPKVGKTTFTAIAVSSLLKGQQVLQFIPKLPGERKKVLWIDTEQGKPECVRTIQVISKLVHGDKEKDSDNLIFVSLRGQNPSNLKHLTELAIEMFKDVSFVVIDGIKDYVSSINDEREATGIVGELLKWTQEKNIHILTILHQNKGDANARGHLGTELMNKAETVAKLGRDETSGTRITIVEPEFTRHRDFESFAYSLDDNGNISSEESKPGYQPQNPKTDELTGGQLQEAINKTFNGSSFLPYGKLREGLKTSLKSMDIEFGDNKCKELITRMKENNYLNHDKELKHYSPNVPKV